MGFFDIVSGLADGSLIDDTLGKLENGLDRVEGTIAGGIDRVDQVSGKLEEGANKIIDAGDQAVQATDGLAGASSDDVGSNDTDDDTDES